MTYKPRMIKKDAGYVVNGSVAILIPKDENLYLTDKQLSIFQVMSSEPFIE